MLTFIAVEAISTFFKKMISIQCGQKGKSRPTTRQAFLRRQKASVTYGMKTSPVERDSFVMNDFNYWWTEIFNENKEHRSDFSALVVIPGQAH